MATIAFETAKFQPEKFNFRIVSRVEIQVSQSLAVQLQKELNGDTPHPVCPIRTQHDSGFVDTITITDDNGLVIGGIRNI